MELRAVRSKRDHVLLMPPAALARDRTIAESQVRGDNWSRTGIQSSSAVSARTRCSRMIWEIAVVVGVLLSSTAVLLGFLTDESIQLYLTSVLVLGVIPTAAILMLGAILVSLLNFLGMIYDLLRAALRRAFAHGVCVGTTFLVELVNSHELDINQVLVQAAGQLCRSTTLLAIWVGGIVGTAAIGAQNGLVLVVRGIVFQALWMREVARRLLALAFFIAGWPIRSSALLALRFIEEKWSASEPLRAHISAG